MRSVFCAVTLLLLLVAGSALSVAQKSEQKVLVPLNLAKGKPVKASASQEGHPPEHATDENAETRWCSPNGEPGQWWQVDLQKPQDLTGCQIVWEMDDTRYRYKVEGSADEKAWQMLSDQTEGKLNEQTQTLKFSASGIRFVRVSITGLQPGRWGSFFEFEAHGKEMVEKAVSKTGLQAVGGSGLAGVKVPSGWQATMFAAPPNVSYPTCLAAAPTGEVFVGIDENGSLDSKPNRGRIVRCVDADNDGKADQFTNFATIDSPRGLIVEDVSVAGKRKATRVYCLAPPLLLAFQDDDGDGISDRTETLVEGIGFDLKFRGADHTTNGIQLGIDGWIYVAVGDYGFIKAVGSDKKEVQLRGGGIARVRPDGSELEVVSRGQRNIYDVAVSPSLDLFTRDNTNDGGGWNVRLSHVPLGAQMGYPTLFTNFSDEIVPALADYGGGSPCGSLFMDEPGMAEDFGRTLLTCDWGRSVVYRHPLIRAGASFIAEQKPFIELPRPTDIDVDGQGRFFVSTWKDGGFNFSRPDVGYVVRVTDPNADRTEFPNLSRATVEQLVDHIGSRSHVLRLHAQRELLRRTDDVGTISRRLEQLAASDKPQAARVAAIFTLKQILKDKSVEPLVRLSRYADLREFALKALADRASQNANVPAEPFIAALSDPQPRIRLQAVIGLGRLGKKNVAEALVERLLDSDLTVLHATVKALIELNATEAVLKAVDPENPELATRCGRVLQAIHETSVVDGVLAKLSQSKTGEQRRPFLTTLARLQTKEADWDGKWWGTRPDTSGPYFKPVTWSESDRIAGVLKATLLKADLAEQRWLLNELRRHKVAVPEASELTLKLAATDASLRVAALDIIAARVTDDATLPLLQTIVGANESTWPVRAKALRLLQRLGSPKAMDVAFRTHADWADETSSNDLITARDEFLRDARHAERAAAFALLAIDPQKAAGGQIPASKGAEKGRDAVEVVSELAFAVLLHLSQNNGVKKEFRELADKTLDSGWRSEAATIRLLRGIAVARFDTYELQVRAHLTDKRDAVKVAAMFAADQLGLDKNPDPNRVTIGKLPFEQVVSETVKAKGDANLGRKLFLKQGCVACHTISKEEPLKGPLLQDITKRYKREELIESILKPNAKIAQGFETQFFVTESGRAVDGFVVRESGDEIELRNAAGIVSVIKVKEIEERGKRETSMMPIELVNKLTTNELASLLAYLESLAK